MVYKANILGGDIMGDKNPKKKEKKKQPKDDKTKKKK
jgi:hypothetical protein